MNSITPGRKPTLGEVIDYYTRDDFLMFLLYMLAITQRRHRHPDKAALGTQLETR